MKTVKNKKAFTLIELLVVISIIALLLSIITPALSMAKEHARRLVCSTNLKTLGTGLQLYTDAYKQKLIPNVNMSGTEYKDGIRGPSGSSGGYQNWQSYFTGMDFGDPVNLRTYQLGRLFGESYMPEHKVYYCPTAKVVLTSNSSDMDYYTKKLIKYMPMGKAGKSAWGIPAGEQRCRSNYMYWTWEKTRMTELGTRLIVVDNLLSIAHSKRGKPYGANALFTDGHVNMTMFSNEPELLKFVLKEPWEAKSRDYAGFVNALKLMKP